jgi:hypothetical protein
MRSVKCRDCGNVNQAGTDLCEFCGASLPKAGQPWWFWLGALFAAALLILGLLFLWASPVANTASRVAIGVSMLLLGGVIIWRLNVRHKRHRQIEVILPQGVESESIGLVCRHCGRRLDAQSIVTDGEAPRLVCQFCQTPFEVKEEPKW